MAVKLETMSTTKSCWHDLKGARPGTKIPELFSELLFFPPERSGAILWLQFVKFWAKVHLQEAYASLVLKQFTLSHLKNVPDKWQSSYLCKNVSVLLLSLQMRWKSKPQFQFQTPLPSLHGKMVSHRSEQIPFWKLGHITHNVLHKHHRWTFIQRKI